MSNCFYCGIKKRGSYTAFYPLGTDGYEICQSCMNEGYWKDALEIIEHNQQIDKSCTGCIYEDEDGSTTAVGNCVSCSRNVDFAREDHYVKRV